RPLHDGDLLCPVCHGERHVFDALYILSRQSRVTALSLKGRCCCGAAWEARILEEESPLCYHLQLGCMVCANWVTVSGRLEEVTPWVSTTLWSSEARHELDRL